MTSEEEQADFAVALAEQLKKTPWLVNFLDRLRPTCHDCGVKIGEIHKHGCDAERCSIHKSQWIICGCEDSEPETFIGIFGPEAHKICLDRDLWCRTLIMWNFKEYPVELSEFLLKLRDEGKVVKWHVPCKRTDPGADADLNRAAAILMGMRA
jgi:hypothetical protein